MSSGAYGSTCVRQPDGAHRLRPLWFSRSISGIASRRAQRARRACTICQTPKPAAASSTSATGRARPAAATRLRPGGSAVACTSSSAASATARRDTAPPDPSPARDRRSPQRRPAHPRRSAPQRRRLVAQDRGDEADLGVAGERPAAGEHLVEDGAEREDVGPRVDRPPLRLLRRHVGRGAEDRCRAVCRAPSSSLRSAPRSIELREAEVEHLRAAVARDQMLAGLMSRWTMPAACAAASADAICAAYASAVATGSGPPRQQRVERHAIDELHRDERRAVVLVDLVDGDDVRVVERRGGARFLDEAARPSGSAGRLGRQDLDRDRAAEPRVDAR